MSLNITQSNNDLTLQVHQSNVKATLSVTQSINELHITAVQNSEVIKLQPLINTNASTFVETDPIFQASEASLFVIGDKSNLDNQSGVNTGDETTSSIQTKRPLKTVNNESLEGTGNIQIDYNDLDNLPTSLEDFTNPTVNPFVRDNDLPSSLEDLTNPTLNPFIRANDLVNFDEFIEGYFNGINFYTDALFTNLITPELNKYYVDLATTPSKIYRWSGTTFVAVGGGGGSSFIYDFLCPVNNFVASTLAYTMRFNVSSPIFNPIFEASPYYNWSTDLADTRITAHPVISNQKVKKIVFSYNKVSTSISIKLIYFKVTGINHTSLDNLVIFQKTISNPSDFKQISIDIPTEIELEAGGFISMVLFNNNVACSVANLHIKLLTEAV